MRRRMRQNQRSSGKEEASVPTPEVGGKSTCQPLNVNVRFDGVIFHGDSKIHPGFETRVTGTIFDPMFNEPSSVMTKRGKDNEVLIEAEHFPNAVVDLFPDIWYYLQTGQWQTEITTLGARMRWQEALAYVGIKHPRVPTGGKHLEGIILNNLLLQLPDCKGSHSYSIEFEETACNTASVCLDYDDEDHVGALILRSRSLGSVKINPELGSLSLKLPGSPDFDVVTRHPLLKHKNMTALVMRETKSDFPMYGDGMLIVVQVDLIRERATRRKLERLPAFVEFPAFWFVVCLKRLELNTRGMVSSAEQRYVELHTEVLPGGLRTLTDGSVILLSNPDSLRKALLSMFLAKNGVIQLPALNVNPIAPQGPVKAVHTGDFGQAKGKASGGKSMRHLYEKPNFWSATSFPTVRTLHPQGRAPQYIWIVKRGQHLVLLIHAADGRVALGQIEGPHGSVPSRWPGHESKLGGKVARWDVWCRHNNDAPVGMWKRLSLRNAFAVPICREVLAVVPRQKEILILQRTHLQDKPKFWRVGIPNDSSMPPSFVTLGHIGEGKGRHRKGSWPDQNWYVHSAMELSDLGPLPSVCEVVFGAEEQPDFEFQRWTVADAEEAVRSHELDQPVIGPGSGPGRKGCKGPDWMYDSPDSIFHRYRRRGRYEPEAPPPPENTGYSVEHWTTTARIADEEGIEIEGCSDEYE